MDKPLPLSSSIPIVNQDGTPTLEFMRAIQGNNGILNTTASKKIVTGSGVVGGGTLGDPSSPTINLSGDIQALLNGISTTQGTILYKNATAWVGLAPGTVGQFLQTAGAGANPLWATPSGGDLGPAWTTVSSWATTSTVLGVASSNLAASGFSGSTNSRIELEGYVYKLSGGTGVLGLTNGTNGYYISAQSDGNLVFYRYNGGAATSLGASGVDATRNFTGILHFKIVLHSRPSTRQEAEGSADSVRLNSLMTDVNVGIDLTGTLTPFVRTDDTTKCYVRYRTLA